MIFIGFTVEPVWWISRDYSPYFMFIIPVSIADVKTGLWFIYLTDSWKPDLSVASWIPQGEVT